jgi:hypothetical protein
MQPNLHRNLSRLKWVAINTSKASVTDHPETGDEENFEGGEFASLTESLEEIDVKRDARRKIEIYWEKKRLKEQFDDFDESELGF